MCSVVVTVTAAGAEVGSLVNTGACVGTSVTRTYRVTLPVQASPAGRDA